MQASQFRLLLLTIFLVVSIARGFALFPSPSPPLSHVTKMSELHIMSTDDNAPASDAKHVETILFVECGFGADAHGQDSTKAAVRACRNAIEFNQIPSISNIVPGGYDNMKLDVLLAVPPQYQANLDLDAVRQCFPYGQVAIQLQDGGMVAASGKVIEAMGDTNDDMVVVCVAVTVGY